MVKRCFLFLSLLLAHLLLTLPLESVETPTEIWRYPTGEGWLWDVVCHETSGQIIGGSEDGYLYCFDLSGKVLWQYRTGGVVLSVSCDGENGQIVCGSEDGHLYCLDHSGHLLWRYQTGGWVFGVSCSGASGQIVCSAADGHVYCFDPAGRLLWRYQMGSLAVGIACHEASGQVFYGSNDGYLYSLDLSGELLWEYPVAETLWGVACHEANGQILCGSQDGGLYCLNLSGELLWKYSTGVFVLGIGCDELTGQIFCASEDGCLHCLDSAGNLLWQYPIGDEILSIACNEAVGQIFCSCANSNYLCAVSYDRSIEKIVQIQRIILEQENKQLKQTRGTLLEQLIGLAHLQEIDDRFIILLQEFFDEYQGLSCAVQERPLSREALFEENQALRAKNNKLQTLIDQVEESRSCKRMQECGMTLERYPLPFQQVALCPVVDQNLYIVSDLSSHEQTLHCYTRDLNEVWTQPIPSTCSAFNPPVIDRQGKIYYLSRDQEIVVIEHEEQFTFLNDKAYTSLHIGQNGLLYISSGEADLFCINPATQGIIWRQEIPGSIYPHPVIDDQGVAYFATPTDLYAIDPRGKIVHQKGLSIQSPLRIDPKGRLYYLSAPDILTCINVDGEVLWNYTAKGITLPAFDHDSIYIGVQNSIRCLDRQGHTVWQRGTQEPIKLASTPNTLGEVYFLSEEGTLYRTRELGFWERHFG